MEKPRSPKVYAALVLIAGLATVVAGWGIDLAGRRAVAQDGSCSIEDLQNKLVRLEVTSEPRAAVVALNGEADKAACVRRGLAAQICADYLFIPAYGALNLALFLFVRALGRRSPWLLPLGILLSLAMLVGDVVENVYLAKIVEVAGHRPLGLTLGDLAGGLRIAAYVKWGALALSAGVLGALWPARPGSLFVWVPRFFGVASAAVFAYGLVRQQWEPVACGLAVLGVFWLAGVIHAVAVAVDRERLSVPAVPASVDAQRRDS